MTPEQALKLYHAGKHFTDYYKSERDKLEKQIEHLTTVLIDMKQLFNSVEDPAIVANTVEAKIDEAIDWYIAELEKIKTV